MTILNVSSNKSSKKTTSTSKRAAKGKVAKKSTVDSESSKRSLFVKVLLVLLLVFGGYLVYLDALIKSKFEGRRWQLPAKIYSRPLELFSGARINKAQLKYELKQLNYQRRSSWSLQPGQYFESKNSIRFHTRGFVFWDGNEAANQVKVSFLNNMVDSVSVGKQEAAIARLEPLLIGGIYPAHNEDRILVALKEVPDQLTQALIAVEDRSFYEHWGVSPRGIARAMLANIKAGRVRQGGSTLTQQLVKNFYLNNERSLWRKVNEALMAVLLDFHYEKDDILESYLNEVYLGQAGKKAIHGFGLGSLFYFGLPLSELRVDQMALLAGLVKGPSYYDPRRHPKRAKKRRDQVLNLMQQQGLLTDAAFQKAKQQPLSVIKKPIYDNERYPAFISLVRQQLQQDYQEEDLRSEGLRIFTTLDPYLQFQLQKNTLNYLKRLQKRARNKKQNLQAAAVFTNSNTGEVLALMGDKNVRYNGFNRALNAYRPIGSLIKPAVYLTALEQDYSLISLLKDQPVKKKLPNGSYWQPENFEKTSHGKVTLQQALAHSYNLSTVNLALDLGIDNIANRIQQLGLEKPLPRVPALSLGAVSLSPWEVAGFYQTFAAGGFYSPLRAIRSVLDAEGQPLNRYEIGVDTRIKPEHLYLITHAMQKVVSEGTGKSAARYLPADLGIAGKTGTSNDQRDAWFAGWSGSYLGVVWVGDDNNQPTALTGATGALPIWAQTMAAMPQLKLALTMPENVRLYWFDPSVNAIAEQKCPGRNMIQVPMLNTNLPAGRISCGIPVNGSPKAKQQGGVLDWVKGIFSF